MKNKSSYHENEYVKFWIENGIIFEIFKPTTEKLNLEASKIIVRDRLKVSDGITRPIYIEIPQLLFADNEASKYMARGDAQKYLSAVALLVNNRINKLLGDIYIKISRPVVPTKMFVSKEKALEWLEKYK